MYAVLRSKLNLFRKKNSSKMFLSIKRLLKRKKKKKNIAAKGTGCNVFSPVLE